MKKSPSLSILIPIYNVERYLRECLDSVTNQTLQDIEIICLNDGSTDSSLDIIKTFADQDPRIIIIDKPNSGYGDSMNQGLARATGEYIGIVESDDYIDLDAFEKLLALAQEYDADVVRANYYHNRGGFDQKFSYIDPADTNRPLNPKTHTWIFYQAPAIWSAIYRRDFLEENDIKFLPTPGASYQDTGFNFKVWATAERAVFTTKAFLHYRLDNESSSVNNPGKVMNICYEYEAIEKYLKEHKLFDELAGIMEASKFGAYFWNIYRLNPKLLPEFLERTKIEYSEAKSSGLLVESYFESPEQWQLLNFILNHSIHTSISYIRLKKLQHRLRSSLKNLWIKTHPSFRKQKEIEKLIDHLFAQTDELEMNLKSLQKSQSSFSKDQLSPENENQPESAQGNHSNSAKESCPEPKKDSLSNPRKESHA